MTFAEFYSKWNGVGINFDGRYGNQCVDLVQQYAVEVLEIGPFGTNDAWGRWENYPVDLLERIPNSLTAVPKEGDIIIWGKTTSLPYGHIAIVKSANLLNFVSFDQNWPSQGYYDRYGTFIGTGTPHLVTHSYSGVQGWLRLKTNTETAMATQRFNEVKAGKIEEVKTDNDPTLFQVYAIPSMEHNADLGNLPENLRVIPNWTGDKNESVKPSRLWKLAEDRQTTFNSAINELDTLQRQYDGVVSANSGLVARVTELERQLEIARDPSQVTEQGAIAVISELIRKLFRK